MISKNSQNADEKLGSFLTTSGTHLSYLKAPGAYGIKVGCCMIGTPAVVVHQFGFTSSLVAPGAGGVGVIPALPAAHWQEDDALQSVQAEEPIVAL